MTTNRGAFIVFEGLDRSGKTTQTEMLKKRWEEKDNLLSTINNGTNIISDRYAYSGVAYTSAKGIDIDWCKKSDSGLPEPDLVVWLDVPFGVAEKRGEYGEEIYETKQFQMKAKKMFDKLHGKNWISIDASLPKEEQAVLIHTAVSKVIKKVKKRIPSFKKDMDGSKPKVANETKILTKNTTQKK